MLTGTHKEPGRALIEVFLYRQVLDILSTLIGFSLGVSEASPFIRLMVAWGPVAGLAASKILAVGLAALVLWNLYTVLRVLNA